MFIFWVKKIKCLTEGVERGVGVMCGSLLLSRDSTVVTFSVEGEWGEGEPRGVWERDRRVESRSRVKRQRETLDLFTRGKGRPLTSSPCSLTPFRGDFPLPKTCR